MNIDIQQILLHLFNVAILFAIIYFLLYKPVKNFMDKRHQSYVDMDNEANDKLKEAEEIKKQYEDKLVKAEEEIKVLKSEASKAADLRASESEQAARAQAEEIIKNAKAQAESEKNRILSKTGDEIAEIAREAASKVVFNNSSEAFDSFLKAAEGNK